MKKNAQKCDPNFMAHNFLPLTIFRNLITIKTDMDCKANLIMETGMQDCFQKEWETCAIKFRLKRPQESSVKKLWFKIWKGGGTKRKDPETPFE